VVDLGHLGWMGVLVKGESMIGTSVGFREGPREVSILVDVAPVIGR